MKKILLSVLLQVAFGALFAQKELTLLPQRQTFINPSKDKQEYQGFTIQMKPAVAQTQGYGFNILKDNKRVIDQPVDPLPFSPKGIQTKEDAIKIAHWMIDEFTKRGRWENAMPPHIAKALKIKTL